MKNKIPLTILLMAALTAHADYYRTGNSDSDWSDLANWTTDSAGTNPATTIPGTSGAQALYIYSAGNGTTTVFTGDNGALTFASFDMQSANVEFDGANVTINGNWQLGRESAGTAENPNNNTITIGNGSSVSTNAFYSGLTKTSAYTNLVMNITGNSTLTIRGNNWANFKLLDSEGSTAILNIDKGSSLISPNQEANLSIVGSHNNGPNSKGTVNAKGLVKVREIEFTGGGTTQVATLNIYGSGEVYGTEIIWNASGTINFIMKDVSADRFGDSANAMLNIANFRTTNGTINIDLADFYVDGTFALGDYSIALISASSSTFDASIINILNADQMGTLWKLNGDNQSEWLTWVGDTLYLNVTAIPEPGTYALFFGALAFAFAAYRRKK